MGNIKAADVAKLRQQTGAGMMDCKNALVEANGDFEQAVSILRKKGQKIAAKRADRATNEGVSTVSINNEKTIGVAIVLACETDFVAKNDSFKELANQFANIALNCNDKESFLQADFGEGLSVNEKLIEQTGVIGEKIEITEFEKIEGDYVGSYIHGVKIAVLVGLSNTVNDAEELSKDVAMQVASMGATTLSYKDFDKDFLISETEARIAMI
jgi:elongation factor Ts